MNDTSKTGIQLRLESDCKFKKPMKIVFYKDFIRSESYRRSKLGIGPCDPSVRHIIGYGP